MTYAAQRHTRWFRRALAVSLAAALLCAGGCSTSSGRHRAGPAAAGETQKSAAGGGSPIKASVDVVLARRPLFGIYAARMSEADLAGVAQSAGCRPTLIEAFASVPAGISLQTIRAVPGIPILSLEPWHTGRGPDQSDFTLRATIAGKWDKQYQRIARAVVEYQDAVLIRFAHEMNGNWYPWAVANGNTPGEYIQAWRHVVDIFREAGATNALWVWSPNVTRGAVTRTIKQFWPGRTYVDVVGLTGYGVHELSPAKTYNTTLRLVAALTDKPIVLTEVGAQADEAKLSWITNFGPWLKAHPQVAGFIWNQSRRDGDWRFDDTGAHLAAFQKSLTTAKVPC